ncbi:hypothetical protein COS60_01160, partial [Candidatus Wolfebacteria bacterium CG03_land_8_20_14_0_80_39_317]
MKKEGLEVVLEDGSSALVKNISAEELLIFQQWAREEKIVLEACRDGKFFDVEVNEIKSWRDVV